MREKEEEGDVGLRNRERHKANRRNVATSRITKFTHATPGSNQRGPEIRVRVALTLVLALERECGSSRLIENTRCNPVDSLVAKVTKERERESKNKLVNNREMQRGVHRTIRGEGASVRSIYVRMGGKRRIRE